ncbi:acetylserotonin O-methyltransferase [Desulfosarcina sp. OttesenSCG-928-A07]|nr:acetylserotonin O-methyltransferase [Desulfosarcina sp. OttesenSCG-928-G17]MDL2330113.1 acetylserotonin O-methyltransferase [Desulfosarcina sp. OttesenSCG-928-A07]
MTASPYETLRKAASGYMLSSVLVAAAELDCFTWIITQGNSVTAKAVSQGIRTDRRGTEVLLDALSATGFLLKKGSGPEALYAVPDDYLFLLDSRQPDSFVPLLRHMAGGHRTWSRLSWSLRDGKPQERQPSILGAEEDRISFIKGMNSVAAQLVGPTMASLKEAGLLTFEKPAPRLLDVGGASGTYARALLKAVPDASVTIFDLPVGIEQARKRFAGKEFAGRVDCVEGDFLQDALPAGYDFAWLSAIIHMLGREACVHLYRNIHQALTDGGILAIRDYFMHPDRTRPAEGALFAVNMFVNTPHGRVYTFEESKQDLEQAGFTDVRLAVPAPSMSAVVSARKG